MFCLKRQKLKEKITRHITMIRFIFSKLDIGFELKQSKLTNQNYIDIECNISTFYSVCRLSKFKENNWKQI